MRKYYCNIKRNFFTVILPALVVVNPMLSFFFEKYFLIATLGIKLEHSFRNKRCLISEDVWVN
jgi:hypothetical protein